MVKNKKSMLDIPVEFGGVSIGEATARLGIRIARSVCNLLCADETFCGHRLTGKVQLGHSGDSPGQTSFIEEDKISATFDVKRISIDPATISTGLTFNLKEIDISALAKFSNGTGRLVVETVAELPEEEKAKPDHDDPMHVPDTLKASGPVFQTPLSKIFKGAILDKLTKAGLMIVQDLTDFTASNRRLEDIMGPGEAERVSNGMVEYWRDNPQDDVSAGEKTSKTKSSRKKPEPATP